MAISSSIGYISDSADGFFPSATIGSLQLGIPKGSHPLSVGFSYAFLAGGHIRVPSPTGAPTISVTDIQKFSFVSGGNATDVGDLALARDKAAGASSTSDGFVMGGSIQNGSPPGFYTQTNNIQKFPFAIAGGTGTDVADLVTSPSTGMREASATQSAAEVFVVGARVPTANTSNIYKFPFAISSGTVSPIANIGYYAGLCHVFSTSDHGFFQPVTSPNPAYPPNYPIIKFPFAISGSGELTEVGQATPATRGFGGTENQSIDNAFIVGASNQGTQIRKFPFAISSGFSVDTGGDLVTGTSDMMGTSSVTHGYCLGGWSPPANAINVIQKYPFSIGSGGIGSDVGDLVTAIGDGPSGGIQT